MFSKYFNRDLEPQHRTRSGVEPMCDSIQLFLAMHRQVRSLGQIFADQAIGVFIAAALPETVWVSKAQQNAIARVCSPSNLLSHIATQLVILTQQLSLPRLAQSCSPQTTGQSTETSHAPHNKTQKNQTTSLPRPQKNKATLGILTQGGFTKHPSPSHPFTTASTTRPA